MKKYCETVITMAQGNDDQNKKNHYIISNWFPLNKSIKSLHRSTFKTYLDLCLGRYVKINHKEDKLHF